MPGPTVEVARSVWTKGQISEDRDQIATEQPVALVYNGVSHAVMMATPDHLDDLALGFSLSEGIISNVESLLGLEVQRRPQGIEVIIEVTARTFTALQTRRRNLTGRSGCGLCGVESLEQAITEIPVVEADVRTSHAAIQRALSSLPTQQALKQATGGVHGAAWCSADGEILLLREDVGRHNALDKLLGALAKNPQDPGFILLTSRIGYEMVAKAAMCNVAVLAAVSAPTSLAIEQAKQAGMSLVGFVQSERQAAYCGKQRLEEIP